MITAIVFIAIGMSNNTITWPFYVGIALFGALLFATFLVYKKSKKDNMSKNESSDKTD
ncbi:MAG: hypothetical protein J6I69_00870 [Bacilli bacterium]|nr:hypothetical protein [Bacilli bacterium]